MAHHPTESVAILDAGAQYSKVIDRKVRELNVHTDMLPLDVTPKLLIEKGVKAIIISGPPARKPTELTFRWTRQCLHLLHQI